MRPHLPIKCFLALLLLFLAAWPATATAANDESVPAPSAWEAEFEAIRAKTPEAMAFSQEELRQLLADCDRMKLQIENLPESPRKVFRKRLEMTRNLFQFVLQEKETAATQ